MSIRQQKLPIAALERIDDLCVEFERNWQHGKPTSIESILPAGISDAERTALLAELIALEIDYRRRRGESPGRDEYVERFPHATELIRDAFADGEQSQAAFAAPTVGDIAAMFPSLEIIEMIGAGGMGAVYKARQSGLDRIVALKILPEEFGHDIKFALRFTREARTLAKLRHPNIVSVYEFGKVEDTLYFLMEYVDGSTLRDIVQAGQLAPEHALAIVPHLCDALQYAHDQDVIHRDIKPENILVDLSGNIKIADFGLSRIIGGDSQQELLTGTHQIMGTPRYMAPENMEGSHGVDHRADIYSLGVVFYEMLTGELPIGKFAAPSQKVQIDVRLDEVVLRSLEKEPGKRYQRASQIKSDVQLIAATDAPVPAPTVIANSSAAPSTDSPTSGTSLAEQELAGRLLLTRRQLLDRVQDSLKPLFSGQIIQILIGIGLIALGAQCWARNMQIPHRLTNGLIVHVYGLLVISQAALVCTRLRLIDYSKPVSDIHEKLDRVRSAYLRAGVIIGFIWWLMWIPVAVAMGFDIVLHPNCLYVSLVVGLIGFGISLWLYQRALRANGKRGQDWNKKLAGQSIANAYLALGEMEKARID